MERTDLAPELSASVPGRSRRSGRVLRLALPLLVTVAGCAATFWFWNRLVSERRADAVARAGATADSLAASIEDAMESQLRDFGTLLEVHAADAIEPERFARLARTGFGFTSVAASRASGSPSASAAVDARLRPPFVEIAGSLSGRHLEARTEIHALLDSRLQRRAPAYAIRVVDGDAVLYARGQAAPDRDWWVQQRTVALPPPMRGDWVLTLAPSPQLAALPVADLPAYFRTAGVVISLLMGTLLYQSGLAHSRQLALERSHADLRSEIEVRERAEDDLRRLNLDLERRVAERTAELDAAVADLEAFAYGVSHDLRSPLGAVVNFAGLLKEDYAEHMDDEGRDHLERLTASALSALAMMDGLAALSRLGRARPHVEAVDLTSLAAEVFDEVVVSAATAGPRLELGTLPAARGDPAMLRTVFTNLFTNALKFASQRRPLVVEVGAREGDGENVYWVKDNGVGFDPRFSDRVFRVFERLHADRGYTGTGIGLAMVARVIRFHGGRVWAEAEPEAGARVSFTLPRPA